MEIVLISLNARLALNCWQLKSELGHWFIYIEAEEAATRKLVRLTEEVPQNLFIMCLLAFGSETGSSFFNILVVRN